MAKYLNLFTPQLISEGEPKVGYKQVFFRTTLKFDNDRLSFSEPDLPASLKRLDRFAIKHPHEYITVDELKFFRRRRPPELIAKSNICLNDLAINLELPASPLKSEYRRSYFDLKQPPKTLPLRRATSLRLEGLMPLNKSEHQDRYLWFTLEDCRSSRSYPMKKPESLRLAGDFEMEPEYRSSYIMYPMVDRATKILPREMFSLQSPIKTENTKPPVDIEIIQKVNEDKMQREKASEMQQECHLQRRAITDETKFNASPSEYQRQFVPQLIEKAHSIPQISHIKMQGNFQTIPEYQDSFKMYANYAKPEPIIKSDNLRMSGSEILLNSKEDLKTVPEYRGKFHDLPKDMVKEKPLKPLDHLRPNGEFSKDVPEYYESFRDPQIKQVPEKGKCREPYLHLKGKLEFNPEYKNTYINFPRSRPIVPKPTSTFRLPTSNTNSTANSSHNRSSTSPQKYKNAENSTPSLVEPETDITTTPEYRRACYNYQIRERSPKEKAIVEAPVPKDQKKVFRRKSISPQYQKAATGFHRQRRPSILESTQSSSPGLEHIGGQQHRQQKTPKFGRRAGGSVLKNAENCRTNTSVIEGNPKYTLTQRKDAYNSENIHDSFVILETKPRNSSHWMK